VGRVNAFLLLAVFLPALLSAHAADAGKKPVSPPSELCFKQICFEIETAAADAERRRGLMHRDALKPREAMLFLFEKEGILPIWMKNVRFPLDILWLDRQGTIIHLEENVPPCVTRECPSYYAPVPAAYVLETAAGSIRLYGLEKGHKADLTAFSAS